MEKEKITPEQIQIEKEKRFKKDLLKILILVVIFGIVIFVVTILEKRTNFLSLMAEKLMETTVK